MMAYETTDVFELPPKLELISEEKIPSLYSYSSVTNSICSSSTIDLDELDLIESTVQDPACHEKRESKPLQNNFLSEKPTGHILNDRESEVETPEPSIQPVKQLNPSFGKSMSLHDVSNILPLNLTAKSNTVSCETINSQSLSSTTKSKDSGFQRSLSCLSLTSGRRTYDHVQSKVKAYIKNIKDSEALNKKNKLLQKQEKSPEPVAIEIHSTSIVEKDDLIKEIQELKQELHEKSLYIDAQQRNYNKLLLKFAEAKDIIDKLRVQSISVSYSDGNNVSSLSDLQLGLNSFEYRTNKNVGTLGSCIAEEDLSKVDDIDSAETTSALVQEKFTPPSHSSPYEKTLSPVKKIFSSSSCLGRNYKPLTNLKQNNSDVSKFQSPNSCQGQASVDSCGAVADGCLKLNNNSNLFRQFKQSTSIDLPNDDPFDKVKKWQASLPSINLLGSHSSSDFEDVEHDSSLPREQHISNKSELNLSNSFLAKTNENEICNILSQELQNKCIITEMDVDSEPKFKPLKNNKEITQVGKKGKQLSTSKKNGSNGENALFINNKCSGTNTNCLLPPKRQNMTNKPLNCMMRGNSVEVIFPSSELEDKNKDFHVPYPRESSVSENGSTHFPKSSSMSNCRINLLDDEDSSSDDSSSISSSVLGSDSPTSTGSPKRAKRRLVLCEERVSNKVPKITKSKSSQTTFTLREPMLNFTPPAAFIESQMNNRISCNIKPTNYETWFKHRSSSNPPSNHMKTESSQWKAWNERNNANFYVCKDFSFNKSTSLMECIRDMEGMVCKGTRVIRSVVDRNQTTC